ncbi:hypothetical protein DMP17_44405 [Pseudonocardia sp. TMWB2A]
MPGAGTRRRPGWPRRRHRAPSRETALRATETIAAIAHLVSGIEYLLDETDRRNGGMGDYTPVPTRFTGRWRPARAVVALTGDARVSRALLVGWIGAAATLVAPGPRGVRAAAGVVLTGAHLLLHPRNVYGRDGSDQVALLTQGVSALARLHPRRPALVDACLWYVALQGALSYGMSGWAKTHGEAWRTGDAVVGVLRTRTYGHEGAWRLARRHPAVARLLGRSVVAVEALFPLAMVGPGRVLAPLAVASAAGFHLANARLMGLNRFLLAFPAMYPAVLYVTGRDDRPGDVPRDDLMVRVTALTGAAAVAGLAVARFGRSRSVRRPRPGERELLTSRGSAVRHRVTGTGADASAPLIVLENGLGASSDEWEWVRRHLPEDWPVVSYQRAGSGASTAAPGAAGGHDDRVTDDLRDLVTALRGSRPVVLVGHSIGGVLVSRAAGSGIPGLAAVVALDPTLREALLDTDDPSQRNLDRVVRSCTAATRWGLGALLEAAPTASELPAEVRGRVAAHTRDHATWVGAGHDLAAARWMARDRALFADPVPTLVACAEVTVEQEPRYEGLREAVLAAGAAGGFPTEFHVVPRATHGSLLHLDRHAHRVAGLVEQFVRRAGGLGAPVEPVLRGGR